MLVVVCRFIALQKECTDTYNSNDFRVESYSCPLPAEVGGPRCRRRSRPD